MNHCYKTYRNHESLFLKLENHESLNFGSGIMNNESLRKAQQNRRINSELRSIQGITIFFFRGSTPLVFRAFGADSPLVSPVTLVLNVQ